MLNKIKKHWDNKRKKTIEVIAEENIREMEYLMENFKRIEQKNKITVYPSIEPKRKIDEEEFNKTIKPISTIKFNEKYKVMTHRVIQITFQSVDSIRAYLYKQICRVQSLFLVLHHVQL